MEHIKSPPYTYLVSIIVIGLLGFLFSTVNRVTGTEMHAMKSDIEERQASPDLEVQDKSSLLIDKEVEAIPDECLVLPRGYERIHCLQPYFEALTYEASAEIAISRAEELKTEGVIDDCHLSAHFVGEANLEKHNWDLGKAFSRCSFGCLEGCFHGTLEAYISQRTEPVDFSTEITTVCNDLGSTPKLKRQCIHGIGHGLLAHNYLPLVEAVEMVPTFCR